MDGENNGSKPYEQMDDLGGFSPVFGNTHLESSWKMSRKVESMSFYILFVVQPPFGEIHPFLWKKGATKPRFIGWLNFGIFFWWIFQDMFENDR